jgi:4-amino-4-deoxy-L-arabinose transferase-like glycosyltransferase
MKPDDQPSWARPSLLAIAAVAAVLYSWNIDHAGLSGFYSVAVKSMSESWKAFIFGAFDPKATITLDKLAGSFVPQAISAWIFGFHPWSLALPQVIEGVVSVLVMYRVVRRWVGPAAGLIAAGLFAVTPVAASMFGHSMEDGALTMCLVLAADRYTYAVTHGRLRSLIWCGFWIGLGFQAKMLQAWMALPALAIGYLYAAPIDRRHRVRHLLIAGAATLAVSVSWVALYTVVPASARPYIDGSTNNSAISMVFGYNGLERFGIHFPGSVASMFGGHGHFGFGPRGGGPVTAGGPAAATAAHVGAAAGAGATGGFGGHFAHGGFGGGGGWTKLFGTRFGPEIGWLYPLALIALTCGLAWNRRASRTDLVKGGYVMWGTWLITFGLVFSKMSVIPHTAYVASLAPALAALSGAGIVMFWREYRNGTSRGWLLPVAVAAEVAWSAYLWWPYRTFLPVVAAIGLALGVTAVIALVATPHVSRLGGTRLASPRAGARIVVTVMLAGITAMLVAPAAWSASVLDLKYSGTEMNADAGPADMAMPKLPQLPGASKLMAAGMRAFAGTGTLTPAQEDIYRYASAHRDGAPYLMAVTSWSQAAPYIEATGQEVLPMGGFSGTVPSPTLSRVEQLVRTGELRFFVLASQPSFGFMRQGKAATEISSWVRGSCRAVPSEPTLYRCGRD